jgi:hypothetical protein
LLLLSVLDEICTPNGHDDAGAPAVAGVPTIVGVSTVVNVLSAPFVSTVLAFLLFADVGILIAVGTPVAVGTHTDVAGCFWCP